MQGEREWKSRLGVAVWKNDISFLLVASVSLWWFWIFYHNQIFRVEASGNVLSCNDDNQFATLKASLHHVTVQALSGHWPLPIVKPRVANGT